MNISVIEIGMATVLTLDEVAAFLKVHPSTVYRLLKKHQLPAFKVGSDWRFNQGSIERWIEERETVEATQPVPKVRVHLNGASG
jgi:excisionase family DNA binding protein